jgi:hypothetical protein
MSFPSGPGEYARRIWRERFDVPLSWWDIHLLLISTPRHFVKNKCVRAACKYEKNNAYHSASSKV